MLCQHSCGMHLLKIEGHVETSGMFFMHRRWFERRNDL